MLPSLPIETYRKTILTAVKDNQVVVVIAEAGSGKTTRIPQVRTISSLISKLERQMLLSEGYAEKKCIAITQPRRVVFIDTFGSSFGRFHRQLSVQHVVSALKWAVTWEIKSDTLFVSMKRHHERLS